MVQKSQDKNSRKSSKHLGSLAKLSFADLLETDEHQVRALKRGQEVSGTVVSVSPSEILVDIGAKAEGIISSRELAAASDIISKLSVGDKLDANVLYPENDAGQVVLSLRKLSQDVRWGELEEKKDTDEQIEVVAVEVNRGGVICDYFGIRGFLPASQLVSAPARLTDLIGKSLAVKVIEVDRKTNRLIFSQKRPDTKDLGKIQELLKEVEIGQKLQGVVAAVLPFGIFVEVEVGQVGNLVGRSVGRKKPTDPQTQKPKDLSKLEGLVHISEISWEKVEDVGRYFKVGDIVDVMVIAKDEMSGRLNLSIKQLSTDPFLQVSKKFTKDQEVSGGVVRITPYGVIVSLEGGVEGLIHMSKIPPNVEYQVGQKINCTVESIESKARKIALVPVIREKPVLYR